MTDDLASVRVLHRVAVHVVARARQQASGRFSLRATPGGFGTPELGPDGRRVRVSGATLFVESDVPGAPAAASRRIDGSTLRQLAALAGVDLSAPLDVGHDAPAGGDVDAPLHVDAGAANEVGAWFALVSAALDEVLALLPDGAAPTLARLWPEHFDLTCDAAFAAADPGSRVNLGGSPGDGYSAEPYLYVGPWTPDRPGDPAYWNAPFGAVLERAALDPIQPLQSAIDFLLDGYARLAR